MKKNKDLYRIVRRSFDDLESAAGMLGISVRTLQRRIENPDSLTLGELKVLALSLTDQALLEIVRG